MNEKIILTSVLISNQQYSYSIIVIGILMKIKYSYNYGDDYPGSKHMYDGSSSSITHWCVIRTALLVYVVKTDFQIA